MVMLFNMKPQVTGQFFGKDDEIAERVRNDVNSPKEHLGVTQVWAL